MNRTDVNDISTGNDDVSNAGQTEQDLLDAVMNNSPIMDELDVPLPDEEQAAVDPVESVEEVEDPEAEEVVSEDAEEEVEDTEEVPESADDSSTQPDLYTTEDLDLEAKVSVKIDGKDMDVSFGDLIKGYSTEQSLSKKGRELGEARKQVDEERAQALGQLDQVANAAAAILNGTEQGHAKAYHDLEGKIDKARKDEDTFELGKLKDEQDQVQKKYWKARQQKEALVQQSAQQKQAVEQANWEKQVAHFTNEIPNLIPDFNDKVAGDIREFAISEGLSPAILDTIIDPNVVKVMNDYRLLKQGVSKGSAKRKAVPAKKAPLKRAAPAATKQANADKMTKARAFKEGSSQDDQMAFLRQHALNSLSK